MSDSDSQTGPREEPARVVGAAIQDLAAARLGRGFLPLGALALGGALQLLMGGDRSDGLLLLGGSVVTALAMLAHGQRVVRRAFGHPRRWWTAAAPVASLAPPVFGLYVLGWRGLRAAAGGGGGVAVAAAILCVALGVWVLRSWLKVVEVERLARVMTMNMDEYGGGA